MVVVVVVVVVVGIRMVVNCTGMRLKIENYIMIWCELG